MGDTLVLMLVILSVIGIVIKNNFIMFFISIEISLLAVNLSLIFSSISMGEVTGVAVAIMLLVLGAIDTTIGLSILMSYYQVIVNSDLKMSNIKKLKG